MDEYCRACAREAPQVPMMFSQTADVYACLACGSVKIVDAQLEMLRRKAGFATNGRWWDTVAKRIAKIRAGVSKYSEAL